MIDLTCEIEQLLSLLRTDDPPIDRETKDHVVSELRRQEKAKVVAALGSALQDSAPEYRCTIAWVFVVFDFSTAIPHLRSTLQDADDGVRGYVCELLGATRRREAVPLLIEALQTDADGANRVCAAWALGNIGDPTAIPALRVAMQNDLGKDYEGRPVKDIATEAIRRITQAKTASVA